MGDEVGVRADVGHQEGRSLDVMVGNQGLDLLTGVVQCFLACRSG